MGKGVSGRFRAVLMFGRPGVGKGTQAKLLAKEGLGVHVSSGDVFRGLSRESDAGRVFVEYAAKGRLVTDSVVVEVLHDYVMGLIATQRFFPERERLILDGIPRTVGQAEWMNRYVKVERVVFLDGEDPRVY